ncbi:EcsC family protein [Scopulibacillus darangshiensis]|uniref:EcsC family protein n=1 Tax=Scopulibacillus darangshiensis TaxID=442528 RepID=A0A4R2P3B4_9BACL|nr:EcsC family protein [Scopulibacillus darangshiensis]TCP29230.1 EcsC family protein [Scopulibacillus darangshiensis]
MESEKSLKKELKTINKWEKDQERIFFWEHIGRLPFVLLDRITPAFIQKKLNVLIGEIAKFVDYGGRYLVSEKAVEKRLGVQGSERIRQLPLAEMDDAARRLTHNRATFARIQGATTGVGGAFTLAADIPILLGTSLKVLQEMALIYGYDPRNQSERIFIIKCLQFAYAEAAGKKAVLKEIRHFRSLDHDEQMMSQFQGWREVFNTYRDHIGWKKLLQVIPIAGMIIGSFLNKGMIENVAETGQMFYKKRRIEERLKNIAQTEQYT